MASGSRRVRQPAHADLRTEVPWVGLIRDQLDHNGMAIY